VLCLGMALGCKDKGFPPSTAPVAPLQSSATENKGQVEQPAITQVKPAISTSLLITLHGCADLLLSDEQGRRTGYDADAKKIYQDIPHSIYDEGDPSDDDEAGTSSATRESAWAKKQECIADKSLQVPHPAPGVYVLRVQNATGRAFRLRITSYQDAADSGRFIANEASPRQQTYTYRFHLPPPGGGLTVTSVQ